MNKYLVLLFSISIFYASHAQYSPKHDVTFSSSLYDELVDMDTDNNGNVYLLGNKSSITQNIVLIKCTDSFCSLIATYDDNEDDTATRLQVDASGNSYIIGYAEEDNGGGGAPTGKTEAIAMKYNSSGVLQWSDKYESHSGTSISFSGAYYDAQLVGSALYVVGHAYAGAATTQNLVITEYLSNGTRTLRSYDSSFGFEKGYKLVVVGSTIYFGALDNGSLEYFSISTSFSSSTNPTLIGSYATSWSSIDGMGKDGSNVAFYSDLGSSTEVVTYNGSSFNNNTDSDIDNPNAIIIDNAKAIISGSETFNSPSTHTELVIAGYSISTGLRSFYTRLETTPGSNAHGTTSSHAAGLFKDSNGDYKVPGNLVLDTDPLDGNTALSLYAGFVTFDNTGSQLGWDIYEASSQVDQGIENPFSSEVVIAGNKLWVLCDPPIIDLGNDITEDFNPSGNSIVLDAGSGFTSYNWSTGETTQTINVTTEGTYSVTVTNATGCSAFDEMVYTIDPIDQTITWNQTIPTQAYRNANYQLDATASSGLNVVFSSSDNTIAEAVLVGSEWELEIKTPGTVTLSAIQNGNDFYNAAPQVQQLVTVDYPQYYWVGGSGDMNDFTNHWATTTGGSTFHTFLPDEYCDLIFDENSFSVAATVTNINSIEVHDFSVINPTANPIFDIQTFTIHGSVDLASNATFQITFFEIKSNNDETINFHNQLLSNNTFSLNFRGSGTKEIIGNLTLSGVHFSVLEGALTIGLGAVVTTNTEFTLASSTNLINNGSLIFESEGTFMNRTGSSFSGNDFVFKRNTTFDASTGKYSIVGSPITNASTSSLGSLVYSYDESQDASSNDGANRFIEVTTPETMSAGSAYFSAYTGEISVTGMPNTGTVNVPLDFSTSSGTEGDWDGFNLVSNPYPRSVTLQDFINANGSNGTNAISDVIYLWVDGGSDAGERSSTDYMTVNALGSIGGNSARSGFYNGLLGSFQGFFVKATGTSQTLTFTEDMRRNSGDGNQDHNFFRKVEPNIFKLKIGLSSASAYSETLIGFLDEASSGVDKLYDAERFGGNSAIDLATMIGENSYAIQGRPLTSEIDITPLMYRSETDGMHTISIDLENKPNVANVMLIDLYTGEQKIVEEGFNYSFFSEKGTFLDRFEVSASSSIIAAVDERLIDNMNIYFANGQLELKSPSKAIKAVVVYDLHGKLITNAIMDKLDTHISLPLKYDHQQLIIVKVITENGQSHIRKVVLK